jgi:hypothetical protein
VLSDREAGMKRLLEVNPDLASTCGSAEPMPPPTVISNPPVNPDRSVTPRPPEPTPPPQSDPLVGTWLLDGFWKWEITKDDSGYKVAQTTDPGKKTVASVAYDGDEATITFSDTGYAGTITWKPDKDKTCILIFSKKPDDSPQVIGKRNEVSFVKTH